MPFWSRINKKKRETFPRTFYAGKIIIPSVVLACYFSSDEEFSQQKVEKLFLPPKKKKKKQ